MYGYQMRRGMRALCACSAPTVWLVVLPRRVITLVRHRVFRICIIISDNDNASVSQSLQLREGNALSRRGKSYHAMRTHRSVRRGLLMQLRLQTSHRKQLRDAKVYCSNLQPGHSCWVCADWRCMGDLTPRERQRRRYSEGVENFALSHCCWFINVIS